MPPTEDDLDWLERRALRLQRKRPPVLPDLGWDELIFWLTEDHKEPWE